MRLHGIVAVVVVWRLRRGYAETVGTPDWVRAVDLGWPSYVIITYDCPCPVSLPASGAMLNLRAAVDVSLRVFPAGDDVFLVNRPTTLP